MATKSDLRRMLIQSVHLPEEPAIVKRIHDGTLRLRRLRKDKLDGSLKLVGIEGPDHDQQSVAQYLARCLTTGELATLGTLQYAHGDIPSEVHAMAQKTMADLQEEQRHQLSQPLVHHLGQMYTSEAQALRGGGATKGKKKKSGKKKGKKGKKKLSGRKRMVTDPIGHGFRMRDILQGRVYKGRKTTLQVDGDSLGMPNVEKKNLAKIKTYAKKQGYKKVLVVEFGEGNKEYKV